MNALPASIARLKGWKAALAAFLAGAVSALAQAPFDLWPVLFLTLPVLAWLLDGIALREAARPKTSRSPWRSGFAQGALIGWAFGFGYLLAGIYWIGHAFLVEPEKHAWSMPFAVAALPAAIALFYGFAGALAIALWRPGYARLAGLVFALFAAELGRSYLFTGFPWNLFGYALTANAALMQSAAFTGVYGLTLAALLIFTSPAALFAPQNALGGKGTATPLILAGLALALLYAGGLARLSGAKVEMADGIRLRIVQPNIPQRDKWKAEKRQEIFDRLTRLSRDGADGSGASSFTHLLWPESSVPFLFGFNDRIADPRVSTHLGELLPDGATLILGAERAEGWLAANNRAHFERVFNSLFVLDSEGSLRATYDKTHLVPFGEYVPFRETLALFGLGAFAHRLDGFAPGAKRETIRVPGTPPFSPLICYEIIFPGRVAKPGDRPDWLVNLTNDAWFGNSSGPWQHLQKARVRAVEEGLPVVRIANTGISAIVDPYGNIVAKLSLNETGVIDHGLPKPIQQTIFGKAAGQIRILLILFPMLFYLVIVSRLGRDGSFRPRAG